MKCVLKDFLKKKRLATNWNEAYCWINRRKKTSNSAKISSYVSISHFLYDYLRFIKIQLNTLITQYITCYVTFYYVLLCCAVFCYDILDNTIHYIGTAVAQWLRCCVTNRKVAGSIPAGVIGFFIGIKYFRSHYGPGVDSACNRNEYQASFLG